MSQSELATPDLNQESLESLYKKLFEHVEAANRCVYQLDSRSKQTPVDQLMIRDWHPVYAKREDMSPIHSYKWRGAYYKLHSLAQSGNPGPFIAASAGNHGQGVALAARKLNTDAIIFVPRTTSKLKQKSIRMMGGSCVKLELFGDCFDDAFKRAEEYCKSIGGTMIPAFDDLHVIAGQATVGLEILQQQPNLDKLYVPVGGGGLASGVAFAIKQIANKPWKIIGVECDGQDSMTRSLHAGKRVQMSDVDIFCDGTAVRTPGVLTFEICRDLLDDLVVVSNSQVRNAIHLTWDCNRFIPEPSGAIALAAADLFAEQDRGQNVGVIVSGSNTDFKTLPRIVSLTDVRPAERRFFQFRILEKNGTLIELLDNFMPDINIVDFQYGRSGETEAFPILGIEGPAEQLDEFARKIEQNSRIASKQLEGPQYSEFRTIPYWPEYLKNALFLKVDFPDRPGALRELMRQISDIASICYFDFTESGESVGHALIGFDLLQPDAIQKLFQTLQQLEFRFESVEMRFNHFSA